MKNIEISITSNSITIKKTAIELSKAFDCNVTVDPNNIINVPPKIGEGYIQFLEVEPGLAIAKQKLRFNDEVLVTCKSSKEAVYLLRFISYDTRASFSFEVTREFVIHNKYGITSLWWSSHYKGSFYCPDNTWVRGIWLIFGREWLISNARRTGVFNKDVEQKLLNNQPVNGLINLGTDALKMVEEWLLSESEDNQNKILLKGKILLLFSTFLKQKGENNEYKKINSKDAITIMTFINHLKQNIEKPWPKINDTAEHCGLSQSKFIRVFNEVYKKNYYEYYRQLRMEKAAESLNQGYSVFETASSLGFLNVSHFTSEFKKHFLVEPSNYNNK